MAQVLRQNTLTDQNARPIAGANIYVYDNTGVPAVLTSDGTTPLSQPVITDTFGNYKYYANTGVYTEDLFLGTRRIWEQVIAIGTGADVSTLAALAASGGSALVGFQGAGTGAVQRTVQSKERDIVGTADYSTAANAQAAANNLLPIVDTTGGSVGYLDTAFSITKVQAASKFKAFQTVANGVGVNAFQSIIVNGTLLASTNANFLATATPDLVTFSGWGLRGGTGSNPLVVSNYGAWFENNSNIVWTQEIDCNNEGATQTEGSDNGGIGLALNTGSTYSPDSAISIRRMTGAGTGPGWLRGINIEGARNVGVRVMAMSPATYTVTPAAPGTISAFVVGVSGDAQYRGVVNQNFSLSWGPGNAVQDVTLGRSSVGVLLCSGAILTTGVTGYGGTGSGGTVTQATSRTTGVTLNAPNGEITLFSTTTTAGQQTTFQLSNSNLVATDHLVLEQKTGTGLYVLNVTQKAAGLFNITVYTPAAVGVAEAPVISFAIIKGTNS